jgi:hypothetical protein
LWKPWRSRRADRFAGNTHITATVRADGLVEFGGGVEGRYPADATGWRATTAALNNLAPTYTSTSGTAEKSQPGSRFGRPSGS